jgi:hypothetical protein
VPTGAESATTTRDTLSSSQLMGARMATKSTLYYRQSKQFKLVLIHFCSSVDQARQIAIDNQDGDFLFAWFDTNKLSSVRAC